MSRFSVIIDGHEYVSDKPMMVSNDAMSRRYHVYTDDGTLLVSDAPIYEEFSA